MANVRWSGWSPQVAGLVWGDQDLPGVPALTPVCCHSRGTCNYPLAMPRDLGDAELLLCQAPRGPMLR